MIYKNTENKKTPFFLFHKREFLIDGFPFMRYYIGILCRKLEGTYGA